MTGEALVPLKKEDVFKPWMQLEDETDKAYEAFCIYLQLEKRGKEKRRYKEDVTNHLPCTLANLIPWAKKHNWEERAEAYDYHMNFQPAAIVELAHRRELATEYKSFAKKLRQKAEEIIDSIDVSQAKPDDAVKIMKLAVDMELKVEKLESPDVEEKRSKLKDEISGTVSQLKQLLAGGLGGITAGGTGGTVTATERTVSFNIADNGEKPIPEVQDVSGEVCEGSFESDVVGEAD